MKSIKKASLLLAAGLLTAVLGFGQATKNTKIAHTLLWKITGKGLTKPSYLFGTMHILCADDAILSDSLKGAIRQCDEVYFEINLSDMAGMMNSMRYMRMNDNTSLSDL